MNINKKVINQNTIIQRINNKLTNIIINLFLKKISMIYLSLRLLNQKKEKLDHRFNKHKTKFKPN